MLTTIAVAFKTSDAGKEFLAKNFILINAFTLAILAFFLVNVLHDMPHYQHFSSSFFATLLLLVLATIVSVLALRLLSWYTSFIALVLWMVVFTLITMFKCQELYKPILTPLFETIKKLIQDFKQIFENYWH